MLITDNCINLQLILGSFYNEIFFNEFLFKTKNFLASQNSVFISVFRSQLIEMQGWKSQKHFFHILLIWGYSYVISFNIFQHIFFNIFFSTIFFFYLTNFH